MTNLILSSHIIRASSDVGSGRVEEGFFCQKGAVGMGGGGGKAGTLVAEGGGGGGGGSSGGRGTLDVAKGGAGGGAI